MLKRLLTGLVLISAFTGSLLAAGNQPPTAQFTVTPGSGTVERTFQVDASASTDDKTAPAKLKVRWDWENDGIWDTAYTTVKTASHRYETEGARAIRLQVQDSAQAAGTTTRQVDVLPPATSQRYIGATAREPDVDVNPTDVLNLVVSVASISSSGLTIQDPAYASLDGGATWTRSLGEESNRESDPGFEFTPDGTAVLMSYDDTGCDGNVQGVQIDLSTDKGLHFTRAGYAFDQDTLFLLPDGSSRAVCGQRATFPCMQPSDWDGVFFDYPKIASDKGSGSPYAGNLYAIAHMTPFDQDGDGTCESAYTVFARSTDGGATWTSARALAPSYQPTSALGVGADGTVYFASKTGDPACTSGEGIELKRSGDGGATFGAASCACEATPDLTPVRTWTAADPANASRVYVVFDGAVPSLGGSLHVFAIRSTDAGATWSAPVRIDDVLPDDNVDHLRPSVSVSSGGRLDVAWFDYRNSSSTRATQNGQEADVFYAYSEDGGVTWSRNLPLTPAPAPALYGAYNDFLTITSSGNKAHAAYSLSPSGTFSYEAFLGTVEFN